MFCLWWIRVQTFVMRFQVASFFYLIFFYRLFRLNRLLLLMILGRYMSSLCHSLYFHPFSLSLCSNPDWLIRLDSLTSQTQKGLGQNHRCLLLFFVSIRFWVCIRIWVNSVKQGRFLFCGWLCNQVCFCCGLFNWHMVYNCASVVLDCLTIPCWYWDLPIQVCIKIVCKNTNILNMIF